MNNKQFLYDMKGEYRIRWLYAHSKHFRENVGKLADEAIEKMEVVTIHDLSSLPNVKDEGRDE